jgi:hypothetical protein
MQSLCTLRNDCRQWLRNTRYQADATPYLGRTSTGSIAPALPGAPIRAHLPSVMIKANYEVISDRYQLGGAARAAAGNQTRHLCLSPAHDRDDPRRTGLSWSTDCLPPWRFQKCRTLAGGINGADLADVPSPTVAWSSHASSAYKRTNVIAQSSKTSWSQWWSFLCTNRDHDGKL